MNSVLPSISPQVSALAPGFRALSIDVVSAAVRAPQVGSDALRSACKAVLAGEPQWAEAHLQAWSEVFRAFGAKPPARLKPCANGCCAMARWPRSILSSISITR